MALSSQEYLSDLIIIINISETFLRKCMENFIIHNIVLCLAFRDESDLIFIKVSDQVVSQFREESDFEIFDQGTKYDQCSELLSCRFRWHTLLRGINLACKESFDRAMLSLFQRLVTNSVFLLALNKWSERQSSTILLFLVIYL